MRLLFVLISFFSFLLTVHSQEGVPFSKNKSLYVAGNSILIGNNILGDHHTDPLMDNTVPNDLVKMKYIDVDDDKRTFSSSQAKITYSLNQTKIVYAALYWSALYPSESGVLRKSGNKMVHVAKGDRDPSVNSILFKTPGSDYKTVTGDVIFDSYTKEAFTTNIPYACYADVTEQLQQLPSINGVYTVANIKATKGEISGGGSAGWLLYIVYEDLEETPKYFTTYNGFVEVNKEAVEITFKDFKSKDEGIIKTTIALGALEGDRKIKTDAFFIFDKKEGAYKVLSNKVREKKNFFNSSITINDSLFNDRNPNSSNTLGFDLLKMQLPNPNNELFDNATTQADLKFQAKADRFYLFFMAFETEINNRFYQEKLNTISAVDETVDLRPLEKTLDSISITEVEISPAAKAPIKEKGVLGKSNENKKADITIEEAEIRKKVRVQSLSVPGLSSGYYLVTNVFSVSENATRWSQFLTKKQYNPQSFINPKNNWNYVYTVFNKELKPVFEKWEQSKGFDYFKEIWIIKINL